MVSIEMLRAAFADGTEPLHYREITDRVRASGDWATKSKTPEITINNLLNKNPSIFQRPKRGYYSLVNVESSDSSEVTPPVSTNSMTYLDAAERVLREKSDAEGMSYKDIAQVAVDQGLIEARNGISPESNLNAQISMDIKKRSSRGQPPKFIRPSRGVISLAHSVKPSLLRQIDDHNKQVRKNLHERLMKMDPFEFEKLILTLLTTLGYIDTALTRSTKDGGIDVKGTLVVADVIETRMAVQAKRWSHSVGPDIVQKVRGALKAHEHGLIVTTGSFTKSARKEAQEEGTSRIGLMDGRTLVNQLIEHEIGIMGTPVTLLDLAIDANEISN